MKATALHGAELQLGLADIDGQLIEAVRELGFARRGALWVRSFPGGARHAVTAGKRFEACAETMVRQCAGSERVPWEDALELVAGRARSGAWWLAGSAALAVRGVPVSPRDIDLIADVDDCERLADELADLLIEPISEGGFLGERWFRAFAGARIECLGGPNDSFDFGRATAMRLDVINWRGHALRVPPLNVQLESSQRRGLHERAELIREAL